MRVRIFFFFFLVVRISYLLERSILELNKEIYALYIASYLSIGFYNLDIN